QHLSYPIGIGPSPSRCLGHSCKKTIRNTVHCGTCEQILQSCRNSSAAASSIGFCARILWSRYSAMRPGLTIKEKALDPDCWNPPRIITSIRALEVIWRPICRHWIPFSGCITAILTGYGRAGPRCMAGRFGANYDRREKVSLDTTMLTSMHPGVFLGAAGEAQAPENLTSAIAAANVNKAIGLGAAATFRVKPPNSLNAVVQDTVTNIHRLGAEAPLPEVFLLIGDVPVPKGSISALRVFLNGKNPSLNTPL